MLFVSKLFPDHTLKDDQSFQPIKKAFQLLSFERFIFLLQNIELMEFYSFEKTLVDPKFKIPLVAARGWEAFSEKKTDKDYKGH